MSYFRIILIPVFCYFYLTAESNKDYYIAGGILLISTLTDFLDGKIARKFHMITELGKALDPIADKVTHGAIAICLCFRFPLMWALVGLMLVKEGYMAVIGIINLHQGKKLDGAMWFGKVCTAVLFFVMLLLVFLPQLSMTMANLLIVITMVVMLVTLILYMRVFHQMKTIK